MNWDTIGLIAGMILPLWDIPLIIRVIRRKSADDISVVWAWGLWVSSVLMAPSAFVTHNLSAIGFNTVNVIMVSLVLIVVMKYRRGKV